MTKTLNVKPREAAQILGVSLHFVYQLLWADQLKGSKKIGKNWAIPVTAIESRLKGNK